MPNYTERDRDSIVSAIFQHTQELEKLSPRIIKAEIPALPEAIAAVEKATTSFITRLRVLKRSDSDPQD